MRIQQACRSRCCSALRRSACRPAPRASTPRCRATRRCPRRRARPSIVVPGDGMAITAGSSSSAMPASSPSSCRRAAIARRPASQSATMVVQLGYGVDHGPDAYVDGSVLPRAASMVPASTAGSIIRASAIAARVALLLGLGRSVLVRRLRTAAIRQLRRISQPARPPHPPQATTRRCSTAAPRRARRPTSSDALVPSLVEAMFTGFPGRRRDGQDHHPAERKRPNASC